MQNPSRVGTMPILPRLECGPIGTSKGDGMRGPGETEIKPTDVLYVIEFLLKDKIKAIDKQMEHNAVIVGHGSCGFGRVY
jgi:hypothetical protein